MEDIKNYIAGSLVDSESGQWLENFEPATGKPYSRTPDSTAIDVARAVAAGKQAFATWSKTNAYERSRILRNIARIIQDQTQELSRAESIDNGKPISVSSTVDIPRSALNFEFYADAITQFSSEAHITDSTTINYTLRHPLGVVGCISPWNLPLYLLTWKIAPALAAGNCVVAKPSEVTPMTAYLLSKICIQAGLPPGVLNIVHGLGHKVGDAISKHPDIAAVSFTGSTRTGVEISKAAGPSFKKLSLEMGGKNPNVIFADCDFDEALSNAVRAAYSNQGQICLCGSRIFVEAPIYDKFKNQLIERVRRLKVGDPLENGTDQGALVSREHMEKVLAYIDLAKSEGGNILAGGKKLTLDGRCKEGWFVEPTLIDGLESQCRVNQEEIFGPVASLIPFHSEAEVLDWANSTRYGLAASIWTKDLSRAHRFAAKLHTGIVWVNCWMLRDLRTPFGGMKESGVGREGGLDALRFFTEPQNVCIKI